jgi:O-succinylhomoserine sulfhydrylase
MRPATALVHGGTLRSSFEETSEALFLTQGFVYETGGVRGALQRHRSRLHLLALLEPDGRHVRGAHGGARRRRGGAGDGERHGGGDGLALGPAARRRSRRRGAGAVRLLPLRRRGAPAALRRRLDARRRHAISRNGARRCGRETKAGFLESPTNPGLDVLDIPAIAEIVHAGGARLVVDNVFATPLCRSRSSSAPIASSIPRRSTSTGRAAASAA